MKVIKNKGVMRLLRKLTLLALPFLVWPLVEVFVLPMNFFTFRIWETISVNKMRVMSGPFYPNIHMQMEEEGELAPHTPFARKRVVEWYTDEYGYRNRDTKCEVLLIGDSNITGAKLSQEETLAEVLERKIKKDVYSFAPATVNRFLATDRFQQEPPELVIVSSIERRIPELPAVGENGINSRIRNMTGNIINSSGFLTWLAVTADRISKLGLYHKTLATIDRKLANRQYINYNNEFFIEGEIANRTFSEQEVQQIADVLEGYKLALQERGIKFLFLPIPNKENIYYKMLPSKKKPDFLPRLMAELRKRDVAVVDMQTNFEQLHQENNVALYPVDDAHWNNVAVEVAANLVTQRVQGQTQESDKNESFFVNYADQKRISK
ncbi:alginate O-acetyltransferase AlgX-related protein [Pontibacter sp. MBLB2868]|uniref:alginate O-acetyltransferase AlgX-related protein n=1 Tax=Pontibacter sp. MBLB2868 TaxID=3451555 RepID=UPI003F7551E9